MRFDTPPRLRGPADPQGEVAPLGAGTWRRWSVLDVARPDGLDGLRRVHGHAWDDTSDDPSVPAGRRGQAATLDAEVEPSGAIVSIAVDNVPVPALVGVTAGPGFRGRAASALPGVRAASGPAWLLLDDLPAACLVSGYATLAAGRQPSWLPDGRPPKIDICAGWRAGGSQVRLSLERNRKPFTPGPPAPAVPGLQPPGPLTLRRIRRIDVQPGDTVRVEAMFRDTYVEPAGTEVVVHEYALTAEVDPRTLLVVAIDARPRVLPYIECPDAAASAQGVVGRRLDVLRDEVRAEITGTSTCTHLNDLLRSLEDVAGVLADAARLPSAGAGSPM